MTKKLIATPDGLNFFDPNDLIHIGPAKWGEDRHAVLIQIRTGAGPSGYGSYLITQEFENNDEVVHCIKTMKFLIEEALSDE